MIEFLVRNKPLYNLTVWNFRNGHILGLGILFLFQSSLLTIFIDFSLYLNSGQYMLLCYVIYQKLVTSIGKELG